MNKLEDFIKENKDTVDTLKNEFGFWDSSAFVFIRERGKCYYCEQDVYSSRANYALFCLDHILPQAHFPELKDDPDNWVLCCNPCNKAKRDKIFKPGDGLSPEEALKNNRDNYLAFVKIKMKEYIEEQNNQCLRLGNLFQW